MAKRNWKLQAKELLDDPWGAHVANDIVDLVAKWGKDAYSEGRKSGLLEGKAIAEKTASWYPSDVFIEPPPGQHGKTVDACSARSARHICKLIAEDCEKAAGGEGV